MDGWDAERPSSSAVADAAAAAAAAASDDDDDDDEIDEIDEIDEDEDEELGRLPSIITSSCAAGCDTEPGDSDEAEAEEADSGGGASLAASSDAVATAGAVDLNWRKPERWYSARASSACCTVLCIPGVRILPP